MGVKDPTAEQEEHRHKFKRHLLELKRTGINVYLGGGGIGKTLLLKEFEKLANEQDTKFVRYDFKDSGQEKRCLKAVRCSAPSRKNFLCQTLQVKSGDTKAFGENLQSLTQDDVTIPVLDFIDAVMLRTFCRNCSRRI